MEDVRVEEARRAYRDGDWTVAYRSFSEGDGADGLGPDDLVLFSTAAFMVGDVATMIDALGRAHEGFSKIGRHGEAARSALWLAANLASRHKMSEAGGWAERGRASLKLVEGPSVEEGFLLLPEILRLTAKGELEKAASMGADAIEIGRRFGDRDLTALAGNTRGRVLMLMGQSDQGFSAIDEAMLAVTEHATSPMVTGIIYCLAIGQCFGMMELRRASSWTQSLSDWCDSQHGLVAFTDECLAHRAEVMRYRGEWDGALVESRRSVDAGGFASVAANARYQAAEILRLRGEYGAAEDAYREVSAAGGEAQPGLAMLRLAQGNEDAATVSVRRALREASDSAGLLRILPGYISVMVATGSIADAETATEELEAIAAASGVDSHRAWGHDARGLIEFAHGDPAAAARSFRSAAQLWDELGVPYEAAVSRATLAQALVEMGDQDGGDALFEASLRTFRSLGALPDVREIESLRASGPANPFGLTDREVEVLSLVASGSTNRDIASNLVLSERTVDRHVSNIFVKMGVNSRAAATALAVREKIV